MGAAGAAVLAPDTKAVELVIGMVGEEVVVEVTEAVVEAADASMPCNVFGSTVSFLDARDAIFVPP